MSFNLAMSMRVVEAEGYNETRDALSQEWWPFLSPLGMTPLPAPNYPAGLEAWLSAQSIQGVLLTGGNNVCPESYGSTITDIEDCYSDRDATEALLINYALKNNIPLLGVCRGMHMLNAHFGGHLQHQLDATVANIQPHVAAHHDVHFGSAVVNTNSYHRQGFLADDLAPELTILAQTEDQVIEAIAHRTACMVGIQWHPEREGNSTSFDKNLFPSIFFDMKIPQYK